LPLRGRTRRHALRAVPLSDGTYTVEIDVTVAGGAEVWQMIRYGLTRVVSAEAQERVPPEPGAERVLRGVA
jgi:hypothetical protein